MTFKWLTMVTCLLMAGFALDYQVYLDGASIGDTGVYLTPGSHTLALELQASDTTLLNYSIRITPRNLERIVQQMGVPLTREMNSPLPDHFVSGEIGVDVPSDLCGTFNIYVEAYVEEGGQMTVYSEQKQVQIPCSTGRARIMSWLVTRLPWPLVSWLMTRFMG
ncbi:MAG TPA: hypothetical protein ENN60_02000 [archaeon]|nr:hypothetical protein [archaeon]